MNAREARKEAITHVDNKKYNDIMVKIDIAVKNGSLSCTVSLVGDAMALHLRSLGYTVTDNFVGEIPKTIISW